MMVKIIIASKIKHMKQSLITILLTMLISMVGAKAFAHDVSARNDDGKMIYYVWVNDEKTELAVSYFGNDITHEIFKYSGDLIIPESVVYNGSNYSVTSINQDAFYSCDNLTSVDIPNSVTSIRSRAFKSCSSLKSVNLSNSITTIENDAFIYCFSLTSITIPNSLTNIGINTFAYCISLNSVTIPNSVTIIENSAFFGCTGLTSITIPNSVTKIEDGAFQGCI